MTLFEVKYRKKQQQRQSYYCTRGTYT